jgi:PIN domain nuclease of toxin-antitoxin system
MAEVVLDASALLVSINGEPGYEMVSAAIDGAIVSSVNVAEVATKLALHGIDSAEIDTAIADLRIAIEPFDRRGAIEAGLLAIKTRKCGLSLADRACLALGIELGLPVLTVDRAWRDLEIGIEVRLVR